MSPKPRLSSSCTLPVGSYARSYKQLNHPCQETSPMQGYV
jgi:hypothetical protein